MVNYKTPKNRKSIVSKIYFNNQVTFTTTDNKIVFFQEVIQRTLLYVKKNKSLDLLGVCDVTNCLFTLTELFEKMKLLTTDVYINDKNLVLETLQSVNNELSALFKMYGTELFEDLISICFGTTIETTPNNGKLELLKKYFHPIYYKIINCSTDSEIPPKNFDCFEIENSVKNFNTKVYGIKMCITNSTSENYMLVYGMVDDVIIDLMQNKYVLALQTKIMNELPVDQHYHEETFKRFMSSLMLKDYLINNTKDIYNKYSGYLNSVKDIKHKQISCFVKEFMSADIFFKRLYLIQLLVKSENYENQYLAYLLYDLLSNPDTSGNIDSHEQIILFDSFPWRLKQYFKTAMKNTVKYTNELSNFDVNKIPMEQQICLLNVSDSVKEKAMSKLKEIKPKSDDNGSKARQYLDGLMKIPFQIYKREPILNLMNEVRVEFKELCKHNSNLNIEIKEKYTSLEIIKHLKTLDEKKMQTADIFEKIVKYERSDLVKISKIINVYIVNNSIKYPKIAVSTKSKPDIKSYIINFLETNNQYADDLNEKINKLCLQPSASGLLKSCVSNIRLKITTIKTYMQTVKKTLDDSIHSHNNAKKQIERIIGQWINGEHDGYCFGFEGPPGVGKTTLAKRGISNCLKDEGGGLRPFAMIQMGGDSNGSTLNGHNYTYVGSTWGSIVQILIDKKCMNPIIFIDEIDKISKTENGKEIIGILTHLLDPSQNECFQDKYFSGIDIDVSKVLFILSYNDVDAIDKILLDRIHRVKFGSLTLDDKLVIAKSYIMPEILKKMGMDDVIQIDENVMKFIIDEYTCEPGVRKLKELLFEIVGEINLCSLKDEMAETDIPIIVTIEDIKLKYFKTKREMKTKKISSESKIGIINGLWANSQGKGGTLPIQSKMFPCDKFLELKLTGSQGDVMKESMNVALTMAWNLTDESTKLRVNKICEQTREYGVHVHCPDCSTPKNGPSALVAITVVIYSLFALKKIKGNVGVTGEMTMDGDVTEIGGLDLKFLGGIKAGITEFIYPSENERDYIEFMEKHAGTDFIKNIKFHPVNTIYEVFDIIFDD